MSASISAAWIRMRPSKLSSARSPTLDSMKIDAQKRAAREGFDMDIIPTDIATYAGEAKNILRDLQSRNERMFLMTFLVVNVADSKAKAGERPIFRASCCGAEAQLLIWCGWTFSRSRGFVSALPLGVNQIRIERGLTTSAVAIFVPFISQETFPRAARRCITA